MLVEAAGVEPASEIMYRSETTCLVTFMPIPDFALRAQNGQNTRNPSP